MSICILAISFTAQARSQTLEPSSVHLSVLTGAERQRFLAAHNAARSEVEVDPVDWSDELSNHALASLAQQKDALIAAAKEDWKKPAAVLPRHQADSIYGENVAGWVGTSASGTSALGTSASGTRPRPAAWAVDLWLREKTDFDKLNAIAPYRVGDEKAQSETDPDETKPPIIVGHYTQLVWSATRQIGAAKLVFDLTDDQGNHRTYTAIICNYNPPGNRRGQKPF